jgi:hypothetical protein
MSDIFLSYSHNDAAWVRNTLLSRLEQHGFTLMIDYRDFRGGSFSVEEMQRAVIECRRVILVLTPSYITSEWAKFENVMAQTLDPGASQRKLIPILRQTCDIPLRLSSIHYRDLRSDDEHQWELLYRDLML